MGKDQNQKAVMISKELHKKIKIYCAQKGFKMGDFIKTAVENIMNKKEK